MHKYLSIIVVSALTASPLNATDLNSPVDVKPGAFVGAKLRLPLGRSDRRPIASLSVAPTQSRIGNDGMIRTRIGEGFGFEFARGSKPALTLAGTRADIALGLTPHGQVRADQKLGVSTGGWIAIGVGSLAAILGGLYLYGRHLEECDNDASPDNCS